jgi:hypothetical protein
VRPATRPRTPGSPSAFSHSAYVSSGAPSGSPPSSRVGSVVAAITTSISGTTGSFIQLYALVAPSPDATATDVTTASADRSLRTRPSTRRDANGSTIAIRP